MSPELFKFDSVKILYYTKQCVIYNNEPKNYRDMRDPIEIK
mgnify:CR=1 FL=1